MGDDLKHPDSAPSTANPNSSSDEAQFADWVKKCNDEFDRYEAYRKHLLGTETESEKSFDTLLVTLSTSAIGGTVFVSQFFMKGETSAWLILAWIVLGICLAVSLLDRLFTYDSHKKTRKIYDEHFTKFFKEPTLV